MQSVVLDWILIWANQSYKHFEDRCKDLNMDTDTIKEQLLILLGVTMLFLTS